MPVEHLYSVARGRCVRREEDGVRRERVVVAVIAIGRASRFESLEAPEFGR